MVKHTALIIYRRWQRFLRDGTGQMTTELVLIIPAILLALVIVVNVGMFFAEAARFDRVVNEVARTLVTSPQDPASRATTELDKALGYTNGAKGPYRAAVSVESGGELFFEKRTLHFSFSYQLFAGGVLSRAGANSLNLLSRKKVLVIFWSTGL